MKTALVNSAWCILLSCNMIMAMEQVTAPSSRYDTAYYIKHKLEWETEHSDGITHIAYSPLKEQPFFIVGSDDSSISLWREDGTSGFQTALDQQQITALTVRPDAQEIAVATSGSRPSIIFYDVNTGELKNVIYFANGEHAHCIQDIAYSPSGDLGIVALDDGSMYVWDKKIINLLTKLPTVHHVCSARILPENVIRVATQGGKIYTTPIAHANLQEEFNMTESLPVVQTISHPLLSQNGQECIASFIPRIASKPDAITVCIFDILHKTFAEIAEGHGLSHASFSQDRSVCASIFRRMLTTYHRIPEPGIDGFNHIVTHSSRPSTTATALACSPDGSHMVTSLRPNTIALWHLIQECRKIKDK